MYGLPARALTAEEEFILDLCMDRAVLRLAQVAVTAASISGGGVGPPEYYALDAVDDRDAAVRYDEATLDAYARRHRARR